MMQIWIVQVAGEATNNFYFLITCSLEVLNSYQLRSTAIWSLTMFQLLGEYAQAAAASETFLLNQSLKFLDSSLHPKGYCLLSDPGV